MRKRLLVLQGDTHIVPKVNFAFLHCNESAQVGEKGVDVISVEELSVTSL